MSAEPRSRGTIGYEQRDDPAPAALFHAPTRATDPTHPALAPTLGADEVAPAPVSGPVSTHARTTVLPRVAPAAEASAPRPRYERVGALGEGGVGEVALTYDHDIERRVAIKRLLPQYAGTGVLHRFAEEIRTIGGLEHPNIVPIHDVGIDEEDRHYFTMKYVTGETLEQLIRELREGRPEVVRKYGFQHRAGLFMQILHAVEYAHARGILHRDLKPANVMVGPYGEVTVMDWGIAKKIREPRDQPPRAPRREGPVVSLEAHRIQMRKKPGARVDPRLLEEAHDEAPAVPGERPARLVTTSHGALLGTPDYMSPEQARGENDRLDERSDVFALGVILWELMTLEHYLADRTSLEDVLRGVQEAPFPAMAWMKAGAPHEYFHVVLRAAAPDPRDRFQSVAEMVEALEAIEVGDICVQCPFTLTKRLTMGVSRLVERHALAFSALVFASLAGLLGALVYGIAAIARALAA